MDFIIELLVWLLQQIFGTNREQQPASPPGRSTAATPLYRRNTASRTGSAAAYPVPQSKAAPQGLTTSQDPPYERSVWRTVLTLLILALMAALVLFWIVSTFILR